MRVIANHTLDSSRWGLVEPRGEDVVVASWAKSGTTWVLAILSTLGMQAGRPFAEPVWVEQRWRPRFQLMNLLETSGRRLFKSHLPPSALPVDGDMRFVAVARDGRDAALSWYRHHCLLKPEVYALLNQSPGRSGPEFPFPADSVGAFFDEWIDRDGYPLWPFFSYIHEWWRERRRENVLLVHYSDLKNDPQREVARLAGFAGIDVTAADVRRVCAATRIETMQLSAGMFTSEAGAGLVGGAAAFFGAGRLGGWREVLTEEQVRAYQTRSEAVLDRECSTWLSDGMRAAAHGQ